jgi:parallel beta-helix repeat protein
VAGATNTLTKNVAGDKGKGNTGSGIRVAGASNTLTENKASSNKGDGFAISGGLTSGTANLLKNNLANTSSAGNADYENVGAEFRLTNYIKNNGGGNKIDSVTLPAAAKIASFPASGATLNYAVATAGE